MMKRIMIATTVIAFCAGRQLTAENSPAIDRQALVGQRRFHTFRCYKS
jgi:hypothetical protein